MAMKRNLRNLCILWNFIKIRVINSRYTTYIVNISRLSFNNFTDSKNFMLKKNMAMYRKNYLL